MVVGRGRRKWEFGVFQLQGVEKEKSGNSGGRARGRGEDITRGMEGAGEGGRI